MPVTISLISARIFGSCFLAIDADFGVSIRTKDGAYGWSRAFPSKASQPLKHRFKGCVPKEIYNGQTADAILLVADRGLGAML